MEGHEQVLDLYCGTGTLTLLFARAVKGGMAVGVESAPDAVERAVRNAARNGLPKTRFIEGEAVVAGAVGIRMHLSRAGRGFESDGLLPGVQQRTSARARAARNIGRAEWNLPFAGIGLDR